MMRIKKYIKNIFKNKLFLNMIFPYTCVLLVPTVIWLISNLYAMKTNEESVASLITENIVKSVAVVDSNLNQIENMVMQISQNRAFDSFYSKQNISYAEKMKLACIFLRDGLGVNANALRLSQILCKVYTRPPR